jgi:Uncharacterised nucleotidyltransferase
VSPASPFAADFLTRDWCLLLEACSLPRSSTKISALAVEIRDPESLLRLAEEHGVIAHIAEALASVSDANISAALLDSLRTRRRSQLLSTLTMTAELFRVLDLLSQSGIESLVIKGPVLALRAYGDPAARQYGDIDAVVRHADIARAAKILVAAGYESRIPAEAIREGKIPGQYLFRRPSTDVIFELHTERTFRYYPRPFPIEKYFQDKTSLTLDGHVVPALSAEQECVLISIHGAKHFWERLMWISDIAAMVYNHPELDWKGVRQSAADVGAERMVRLALLLAERLLGVPAPEEMRKEMALDTVNLQLVQEIESWLPYAGHAAPTIARRAMFRFRMRGSPLAGARYLTRLSFATTEEDWSAGVEARSRIAEILRRPFRLAKKHRRDPDT